jgi:putative membrane protein
MAELFWSFTHRPYVTLFLLGFLALSYLEQGWLRTLIWVVTGYLIAFCAEYCSTQVNGVPFGWYVYDYAGLENDLLIAGVPFFDSLSFSFLSYVSFSFAQFFMSPLWYEKRDVQRVTPRRVRNSAFTLLLGATLMVVIDLIVDPLTHLGRYWFLGEIYYYPEPGLHFSVPLANYAGWFTVGWVTIFVNQRIDAALARAGCVCAVVLGGHRALSTGRDLLGRLVGRDRARGEVNQWRPAGRYRKTSGPGGHVHHCADSAACADARAAAFFARTTRGH